jgi:3-deoxy-D-manno-octulosonic-acid transferase
VVLETELWPVLLLGLDARGVPWGIASARLSDRAQRRMRRAGGLFRRVLGTVGAVGARTPEDAARFRALGVPPDRIRVTGDLKEDRPSTPFRPPPRGRPRWLAACTRPGEEEIVLDALRLLAEELPAGELVLAPRHPERFEAVADLASARGHRVRRWREREDPLPEGEWVVTLLDEMGVLEEAYRRTSVAFVGGSLAPFGGHSPLEAAAAGRPVLFGPHAGNCREIVDALEEGGALIRVANGHDLVEAVLRLTRSPEDAERQGRAAHRVLAERAGATRRTLEFLRERGVTE